MCVRRAFYGDAPNFAWAAARMRDEGLSVSADEDRRGARWALALLTVIYVFNFADRQLLSIALDDIKAELEVSDAHMGWLTGTAFALFYTVAGIPIGRWADRGRRWTILGAGLALWSAMTSLSGFARSFASLALLRVGVGIGEAACTPTAHSLISDLFAPRRRATAIAVYSVGIYGGIYLALNVGGKLCERYDWRTAFVAFGAPGLVLALVAAFVMREPPREAGASSKQVARDAAGGSEVAAVTETSTWSEVRGLWRNSTFRHLALGAGIKSIAGYALTTWVPTFLHRVHELGPSEAGRWLGPILGIGGAIGTFGGGWLADRLGRKDERRRMQMAAYATLAALPFLYGFLWSERLEFAFALYTVATVLGAMYLAPVFAMTQQLVRPDQRALASATVLFLINLIGLGLGPWLAGALSDAFQADHGPQAIRWSLSIVALSYAWGSFHMRRASVSVGAQPA